MSNLRFPDDIMLLSDNLQQLQKMVTKLNTAMERIGIKINISKSKIMTSQGVIQNMKLGNETLKVVYE